MLSKLDYLVEDYRGKLLVKLIILFGSRARGDYTNESDTDILVVADDLPKDPRESFAILRDARYIGVNPIGLNTEIFLKKLRAGSPFIIEILEDGKVIYADKEFQEQVMNVYKEVRGKYVRKGSTWIMRTA